MAIWTSRPIAIIDQLKSSTSPVHTNNEIFLLEKVNSHEQTIQDLRTTLSMCQKVTSELENKNNCHEKDLVDMGNQVNELEEVIEGLEKERDDFQEKWGCWLWHGFSFQFIMFNSLQCVFLYIVREPAKLLFSLALEHVLEIRYIPACVRWVQFCFVHDSSI